MWGVMLECHKLQFLIISVANNNGNTKISVHSESHRQIALYLEDELSNLSSSFNKWIGAQKSYLQSINGWLLKCVSIAEKSSKKKRRQQPENPLRHCGPPIYATCGVWFDKLETLPANDVTESIKILEAEIASFVPRQEKKESKDANQSGVTSWKADNGSDSAVNMLRDEVSQSWTSDFDRFQRSLVGFVGKLNKFAESSVEMYAEVQEAIQRSKTNYDHFKSKSVAV